MLSASQTPDRAGARRRAHSGFTLVELLVALLVMALLALMSWRGLDAMARASEYNRLRSEELGALHRGLQQWAADLDGLARQFDLPAAPAVAGKRTAAPVALDWNGQVLRLIRSLPAEPGVGLQVVAWAAPLGGAQRSWTRWQSVPLQTMAELQRAWQAAGDWAASGTTGMLGQPVAVSGLEDWQLYFYRGNSWSNALSSSEALAGLPDGVRLVLQLPPGAVLQGRLTRDWYNPALTGGTP